MFVNGQPPGGTAAVTSSPSLLVFATTIAVVDTTPLDLFAGQSAPEPSTAIAPAMTRGGVSWDVAGTFLNNTGSNRTFDISIVFGGVTIYSDGSQLMGANATARVWKSSGTVTRKSLTSAWAGFQVTGFNGTPGGATTGLGDLSTVGSGLSPSSPLASGLADILALNWNVPQRLEFRVSVSAAVANLSFAISGGSFWSFGA